MRRMSSLYSCIRRRGHLRCSSYMVYIVFFGRSVLPRVACFWVPPLAASFPEAFTGRNHVAISRDLVRITMTVEQLSCICYNGFCSKKVFPWSGTTSVVLGYRLLKGIFTVLVLTSSRQNGHKISLSRDTCRNLTAVVLTIFKSNGSWIPSRWHN